MINNKKVLLQVCNAGYRANGKDILQAISMKIHEGEIITLIGPNGAGKTTLLKIILGLLAPTSGTIEVRPSLTCGYVPQKLKIPTTIPISVASFISLANRNKKNQGYKRIAAFLEDVGLDIDLTQSVHTVSGGEFQRLLMARALLRRPELLVLDEPAQGLDFSGEARFYQQLESIRQKYGCSILLVSHDLHLVMAATDRVICLNSHICCEGQPGLIKDDPEFSRLFGSGGFSERFAVYHHEHNHSHGLSGEICQETHKDNIK